MGWFAMNKSQECLPSNDFQNLWSLLHWVKLADSDSTGASVLYLTQLHISNMRKARTTTERGITMEKPHSPVGPPF